MIWLPELSLYYSVNFHNAVNLVSNNDARVNYVSRKIALALCKFYALCTLADGVCAAYRSFC